MRRQLIVLALAAAVVAGGAACDEELDGGGQETLPPGGGATQAATPGPAGAPAQPPPAQPGGVIATREVQDEGATVRIDITGLQRRGQTLTLTFRLTVVAAGDADWQPWNKLGTSATDYTVSGVTLVEPVNAQRYLVARSGGQEGPCACTQRTDSISMGAGDMSEFFATYSAPPPEITTINVEFPRFGAFTNVPIS